MKYTKCTSLAAFERVEAKFYDDDDNERLHHENLDDYLDGIMANMDPEMTDEEARDALVAMAPLRVWAYLPELHDAKSREQWIDNEVDAFQGRVVDTYDDALGDPEGASPGFNSQERAEIAAFVGRWLDRVGVWRCEAVAEYTLSAEDIREILGRSA